mmetsp:Transcript_33931/g.39181  ORF Transcript_33931/g.39181 Transcript_33931/m.39181 type:complete len:105 (-) Transcript_33931:44-358(-)
MSVRPLTHSEVQRAYGAPWTGIGGIFFGLQGLISYITWNKLNMHQNMIPNRKAFMQLTFLVGGGYIFGSTLAYLFFRDTELERLYKVHWVDKRMQVFNDLKFEK